MMMATTSDCWPWRAQEMRAEYDRRYRVWLNREHARDSAAARQTVKDAAADGVRCAERSHGLGKDLTRMREYDRVVLVGRARSEGRCKILDG